MKMFVGRIVTVSDGVGRSVTVSKWGVAQSSRHRRRQGRTEKVRGHGLGIPASVVVWGIQTNNEQRRGGGAHQGALHLYYSIYLYPYHL
jgi:hypothetical protein